MQVLIVHVHPEPNSFNAELTAHAAGVLGAGGAAVEVADLYAEGFDPVEKAAHYPAPAEPGRFAPLAEQRNASRDGTLPPEVRKAIARLERADLVLFQFPLWWHGPPAMLKGWLDRVFVNGGLYTSRKRYDTGHFRGRRALVSITTGAPEAAFGPGARGGDLAVMLWPLHYSLHYMGFRVLAPFAAHGVQGGGYAYQDAEGFPGHLDAIKARWTARLQSLDVAEVLDFPGWDDWDADGRALAEPPISGCAAAG